MKSIRSISDLHETNPVDLADFGFEYSRTNDKTIDIKRLEKVIEGIYKAAIRKEFKNCSWSEEFMDQEINRKYIKPEIIALRSPIACQLASLILVDLAGYINREQYVSFTIKDYIKFEESRDIAWKRVEKLILENWENEFISRIRNNVSFTIWKEVWKIINKLLRNYILKNADHFVRNRSFNVNEFEKGQSLSNEIKSKFASLGIFEVILFEHFFIFCELPNKIKKNAQYQLHSSTGAAIEWNDGFGLYFWNGINVPKEWIMLSESLTKETIISERNIERRRCLLEIIGNNKFIELMDFACIDTSLDESGNPMKLYRTKLRDTTINDFLFYLHVVDPSTKREYIISVPPSYDVHWAKAASFRDKKIQYRHGDVGLLNLDVLFDKPIMES